METDEVKRLGLSGTAPHYVATGHLVYAAAEESGVLRAAPFDVDRLEITGNPVALLDDVMVSVDTGVAPVAVSNSGHLFYLSEGQPAESQLVVVNREGDVIETVVDFGGGSGWGWPRLSPDQRTVAFWREAQIWVRDLERNIDTRITDDGGMLPVWNPGSKTITFTSERTGNFDLYSRSVDLGGTAEPVLGLDDNVIASSWTPDARTLLLYTINTQTQRDLWTWTVGEKPSPFLVTEFDELSPRLSPDGQWVAYLSDQSGEHRVYVRAFPDGERLIPISPGPGTEVVWASGGRELFYRNGSQLFAVAVEPGPEFAVGETTLLFEGPFFADPLDVGVPNYDVSSDGQRFFMVKETVAATTDLTVVFNWFEELKARVPTN